jgi:hypothetical protein
VCSKFAFSKTQLVPPYAAVGGNFATVYDDEHFGDSVAVVVGLHNLHPVVTHSLKPPGFKPLSLL